MNVSKDSRLRPTDKQHSIVAVWDQLKRVNVNPWMSTQPGSRTYIDRKGTFSPTKLKFACQKLM